MVMVWLRNRRRRHYTSAKEPPSAAQGQHLPVLKWAKMNPPQLLGGRYQLQGPGGPGPSRHSYRALDRKSSRPVAVELLHKEAAQAARFPREFLAKAGTLGRLSHPGLAGLLDFGIERDWYFWILELAQGAPLDVELHQQGRLGKNDSVRIASQLSEALGSLHRAGLVHGALWPRDVLLTSSGQVKLADPGVGWLLSSGADPAELQPWIAPQYLSPEQAAGENPTPCSDIYALGLILLEMLGRRLPFPGREPRTLAREHLARAPALLGSLVPDLPLSAETVLDQMLAKDPRDRYQNGDEAAAALSDLGTESGLDQAPRAATRAAPTTGPSEPPGPLVEEREAGIDWKAVALGFLVLLAVGGLVPLWVWVYLAYHPPGP